MPNTQETGPECCTKRGWFFDEGRRCHRHMTPADRELVAALDKRAPGVGIKPDAWPYGPNIDVRSRQKLLDWAENYGLRRAKTSCQGLHWLQVGRCGVRLCNRLGRWMDHVTRWSWNGAPALVLAQPYSLNPAELRPLVDDEGLDVQVHAAGWYGWGTVAIEVWRRETYEEMLTARRG